MEFFFLGSSFFFSSDVAVSSDATQLHLSTDPQSEENSQHRALIGQRRLGFHPAAELQFIRSIALVVRNDSH